MSVRSVCSVVDFPFLEFLGALETHFVLLDLCLFTIDFFQIIAENPLGYSSQQS